MEVNNEIEYYEDSEEARKPSKEERILGAICYAHFLFLVPFFLQKDSEFLKFHMKQWWVLYSLFLIISFLNAVLTLILWSLRLFGLGFMLLFAYTCLWVFVWYKAYLWQKYEIWFLKSLVKMAWDKLNEEQNKK